MNPRSNSFPHELILCALTCVALLTLLFSLQYSYGVGVETYSLGKYIWNNWNNNEDMGHGFLILPGVLFIIYSDRVRLLSIKPSGAWGGLPLIVLGLALYWAGNQADVTFVGLISIMIVLAGCVWWLLGLEFLRALSFPLAFLLFAIPLPGLDMIVALPLRYLMSKISVIFLNVIGIPAVLIGTGILSAPDASLHLTAGKKFAVDVANPCSGIRSLIALMMVGALFAHLTLRGSWRKWVLFLCTPPLAVAGNLARILMLTLGTVAFGSEFALGKDPLEHPSWFHMAAGYLVFIVALLGMMGVGSLLHRLGKNDSESATHSGGQELSKPSKESS